MSVAVVSDSTGYLPAELIPLGVTTVPVAVVLGDHSFDEGTEITPAQVSDALRARRAVGTSRPSPARFAEVYERLAGQGHSSIVSVHLSGEMSGTVDSARVASSQVEIPVSVVDSRTVGAALGFTVRAAAQAASEGASMEQVAAAAVDRAEASRTWIVVKSLDQLRRGGRIGAAQALLGNALMVKPILTLSDGMIVPFEKQRTMVRATARMAEVSTQYAANGGADVIVQHCDAADRASELADSLAMALPDAQVHVIEVGAVISAHVGVGMVSVAVCPR